MYVQLSVRHKVGISVVHHHSHRTRTGPTPLFMPKADQVGHSTNVDELYLITDL
jgi:hypothetical protein